MIFRLRLEAVDVAKACPKWGVQVPAVFAFYSFVARFIIEQEGRVDREPRNFM
jgi:hypothetical protein